MSPPAGVWARTRPARALRSALHATVVRPVLAGNLSVETYGVEELPAGPVLLVANHASHLDGSVVLNALPPRWRARTAVGAAEDFFSPWWRATGASLVFNAFPVRRDAADARPAELIARGWNVLVFGEGTRSADGFVAPFQERIGGWALESGVPVVPVGIRGTYQAMPRGHGWPVPGRPRVAVRFGSPLRVGAGESAADVTQRLQQAVQALIAEDATSWWAALRGAGTVADAPTASWRRIWQQTEEPTAGGLPRRTRIWRG